MQDKAKLRTLTKYVSVLGSYHDSLSKYKPNHNLGRINFPFPSSSTSKRLNLIFMQVNEGFTIDYNTVTFYSWTLTCFSRTQK